MTVHPRARGEQWGEHVDNSKLIGSSPRTRGTDREPVQGRYLFRFIPAHAGNSAVRDGPTAIRAVHPRARGEQLMITVHVDDSAGSSPRTRGTVVRGPHGATGARFIPAHAGNRLNPCGCSG